MKIAEKLFQNTGAALLTLFFIFFAFGQLQRVQLSGNIAFYGHDILLICFVLWQILTNKKISEKLKNILVFFRKNRLELLLLIWIAAGMGIGILAGRIGLKSFLYLGRLVLYIVFVKLLTKKSPGQFNVRQGFAAAGTFIGIWGILQYLLLPDTRFLSWFGWDIHYYRLISTLFDPAFTGMALVLTLGLWQDKNTFPQFSGKIRCGIQLLIVAAIAATFSRASYLALWLFLGLQTLTKQLRFRTFLLLAVMFALLLLFLPKPGGEGVNLARTSTGEARLTNAQESLIQLRGWQWLWGRGLFNNDISQNYATPSHAQLPDSLPVLIINSTGLGGLLLTLLVFLKWSRKWWKKDALWTSLFFAVLVHSLFNNTLLQPFIFLMLWGSKTNSEKSL